MGRLLASHLSPSPSLIFSSIPPTIIFNIFFSQSNILPYHFLFIFYHLIFTSNQMDCRNQAKYKFATLARQKYFDQNK